MVRQLFRTCSLVVSVVCALTACESLRVTSDVNSSLAGTVQCHTFDWAGSFRGSRDSLRSGVANPLNESRLRAAIESNLRSKGVEPASANADCLVGYGIGMRNVVQGGYPGWGWGGAWGWGGRGPFMDGWGWGWDYPYVYSQGIIAVDLYDSKSRQPLWHASVEQSLEGVTGQKAEQKITTAVAAMFTKYPH